jgi:hypothetical protein
VSFRPHTPRKRGPLPCPREASHDIGRRSVVMRRSPIAGTPLPPFAAALLVCPTLSCRTAPSSLASVLASSTTSAPPFLRWLSRGGRVWAASSSIRLRIRWSQSINIVCRIIGRRSVVTRRPPLATSLSISVYLPPLLCCRTAPSSSRASDVSASPRLSCCWLSRGGWRGWPSSIRLRIRWSQSST